MTTQRNRASLYVRLSKQATGTNQSLEGMTQDMRDLCLQEGLTEVALHVDDGLSGGKRNRPSFQAWLADAREGRADVLVAPHVDRLSREGLQVAAELLDVTEGKDAAGRYVHPPVRLLDCHGIDSAHGDAFRLRFVVTAEIARAERERMRDRSRASQRRLRDAGRYQGGTVPYGYVAVPAEDGRGKTLAIEPTEAEIVREAADRVLKGEPLGRVTRWLNHAGVPPRKATEWGRSSIRKILISAHLLGQVTHRGKPVRDDAGEILAPFPPIITEATHAALRAVLGDKDPRVPVGGRRPSRLLSGLLTCHSCGQPLRVGKGEAHPRYACATRSDGGQCAAPVATASKGVEECVTALWLELAGDAERYVQRVVVTGAEDLALVERDIRDTVAELATAATPELFTRLQDLQARREELAATSRGQTVELVPTGRTNAEWWEDAMLEDRRDALRAYFLELVLHPGKPGRRGFDPSRLKVVHNEGQVAEDD